MKEKVLVRVRLPLADLQYDLRLPTDFSVGQLTQTLVAMLEKYSTAPLLLQKKPVLWSARDGERLDAGMTLHEQGITDSELLFLI